MSLDPESPWRDLSEDQGLRDPVNRHTLAIALVAGPVVLGALALNTLGTDPTTLGWILAVVAILGAIGGWLHPRARSLRFRSAIAGVVIATGALATTYAYVVWRGGVNNVKDGYEIALPIVIGGLPGVILYYVLVRHTRVGSGRPDVS